MIDIGGIKQYVEIKGNNINNPILLFLHGGPGVAQSSVTFDLQEALFDDFVVVHWDQRDSGRSYSKDISEEFMSVNQFVEDNNELVDYLLKKFNKEKIYLVGHS